MDMSVAPFYHEQHKRMSKGDRALIVSVSLNSALDRVYSIDGFKVGGRFRVERVQEMAGGKALNVARVAGLLGAEVTAVGFLAGFTGDRIEALAKEDGMRTAFVRVSGESRQCHTFVHMGQESTEVIESGPTITEGDVQALKDLMAKTVSKGDVVCLSGSIPPGAATDIYADLIAFTRSLGAAPLLDASREAFRRALGAAPYAIKPNRPELEEYLGRAISLDELPEIALDLHRKGIEWVLISLGGDGMMAAVSGGVWRVKVPKIQVVTAVGSGDAFVGGWATTVDRYGTTGQPTEELIVEASKRGSAAGVSNALHEKTGTCDLQQVAELMEEIEVTRML